MSSPFGDGDAVQRCFTQLTLLSIRWSELRSWWDQLERCREFLRYFLAQNTSFKSDSSFVLMLMCKILYVICRRCQCLPSLIRSGSMRHRGPEQGGVVDRLREAEKREHRHEHREGVEEREYQAQQTRGDNKCINTPCVTRDGCCVWCDGVPV